MQTSTPGRKRAMLAVQAICSCVKGTSMPCASSSAPEPAIASVKREPENLSLISFTSLLTAARMSAKWRLYLLNIILSYSSRTTTFAVVEPMSSPA